MGDERFFDLQPGTIVNGRYEVVKCLGTGSMGMVYACRHRELSSRIVAMKVLFSEVARDKVALERFRNEIVASYEVNHPNVVRAYEYFKDGELLAFTMEFVGGGDLADKIGSEEQLHIPEIVRMLSQMCAGVQAIHDKGIIHRDLKPENILITTDGDVKITDFGIALHGGGPKLTEYGGIVGTIDYVSPEYLESGQVDGRSDIYALGVLAFEMITGEPPFKGKSVIETMTLRLRSDPTPPHILRPDCPLALSNIVLKSMIRDPSRRYQSAQEMYEDLVALMEGREVSMPDHGDDMGTSLSAPRPTGSQNVRPLPVGGRRSIPPPPTRGAPMRGAGADDPRIAASPVSDASRDTVEEFWQETSARRTISLSSSESMEGESLVPARRPYFGPKRSGMGADFGSPSRNGNDSPNGSSLSGSGKRRIEVTRLSEGKPFPRSVTIADGDSMRRMQSLLRQPTSNSYDGSRFSWVLNALLFVCLGFAFGLTLMFFMPSFERGEHISVPNLGIRGRPNPVNVSPVP